jgi:sterol desaturase/sphingolipid hydroxylase (fatty acid hydroxylase superfamily)
LACLLLVAGAEFCRPRRQREFPALQRRLGNVGIWVANLFLAAFFFDRPARVRPLFEALLGAHLPSWPIANTWLSIAAGFMLLDLMRYALHRCEHAVPLLWRFHALHHSDPDVDVTTSLRHHPIEYVLLSAAYWFAIVVLDIPAVAVVSYGLAVFASEAVQHGNICLPQWIEHPLQPLLVTTDMHRIHHSLAFDQANANYGAVLSIWDRLFSTHARITRAQHSDLVFGVRELPRSDCLKPSSMIMTPWLLPRAGATR